jgi:hypothetical protein
LIFFCAKRHLNPPKNPRNLYFPVCVDEKAFSEKAKNTLSQLEPTISVLVEKIQPYHRENPAVDGSPETDPLVILNFLSNLDKHRMPIPFLVPPKKISFQQSCQFYSDEDASNNTPPNVVVHADPLEHGKTVMEYITNCPIKEASGKFDLVAKIAVEIDGHTRDIFEVLMQLTWYSRLVVDEFEKTLTSQTSGTPKSSTPS